MNNMGTKILLIHNVVNPTRTMFFNKLNDYFINKGYSFKVIFTSKTESNRKWDIDFEIKKMKFKYEILDGKQIYSKTKNDNHYFHFNFDMKDILNTEQSDIIIHSGWASFSAWISLYWCINNDKKFILWNESTKYEESWRRTITKPLVKYLVKKSDSYISFGTRSKEYLQILGAKELEIQEIYNTVDIDYFINQYKLLINNKDILKKKYKIKTKYVLLYLGQLINRKGIYEMLVGFKGFQQTTNKDISLLVVGDLPRDNKLVKFIRYNNIQNVIFTGFLQQDKISECYVCADIFTLPSKEEVWGLAINEAMCFKLPILTAYKVGASKDLIQEGSNGYIMKDNTYSEFKEGLKYIFDNGLIKNNNSLEIINKFRIEELIKNIIV